MKYVQDCEWEIKNANNHQCSVFFPRKPISIAYPFKYIFLNKEILTDI